MRVPCKDCLLVPICKHKHYNDIIIDCDILCNTLYERSKISGCPSNRKSFFHNHIIELDQVFGTKWARRVLSFTTGPRDIGIKVRKGKSAK